MIALMVVLVSVMAFGAQVAPAQVPDRRVERAGSADDTKKPKPPAPKLSATASAVARAKATHKKVEVVERRTETAQVFANPNGSFTAELSATPQRVRRGSGWVKVDTSLRSSGDRVAPAAVTTPISFSGGGKAPLARFGKSGQQVELTWTHALPKPTLSGNAATYSEVLPGVDLVLRATEQGYSKVFVVKSREASRQPALATLSFDLKTSGLKVTNDKGALVAKDAKGVAVFRSGKPQMWDSPKTRAASTQTPTGEHHAGGRLDVTTSRISVAPDQKLLTDPATVFPVSIDPDFNAGRVSWAKVFSGHPGNSYWNGAGDDQLVKVGKCDFSGCNGIGTARSYFQFDIAPVLGKQIISAEFNIYENHAPSCSPRIVELYEAGPYGSNLSWNAQPWTRWIDGKNAALGYSDSCKPNWIGFNATSAVANAVGVGSALSAYMMKATDEGDRLAWKKFGNDARLIVHYNSIPDVPGDMTIAGKSCGLVPNQTYGDDATPMLRARITDPDGGLVAGQFEWHLWHDHYIGGVTTAMKSSGDVAEAEVPAGAFADNATIAYRVRGWDGTAAGPWSGWCEYTIDKVKPGKAPAISSAMYPENKWSGNAGRTGTFTFNAGGDSDVAGFQYGLDITEPQEYVAADKVGGAASVSITPPEDGPHFVYVRAVDRAGNEGPIYQSDPGHGGYAILVGAPARPVGHWPLDGTDPSRTIPDVSGEGHNGTLSAAGATWAAGRVRDAVSLDGQQGTATAGGGPVIATDGTFSVAAWVKLTKDPGGDWKTVVSQDGNRIGAYYLQYDGNTRGWSFRMPRGDIDNEASDTALAPTPAKVGVWTHLIGVHDSATSQMRLYVNGVEVASAKHTGRWKAAGVTRFGTGKWNGAISDYLPGVIDEARVYDRVLSRGEISALVNTPTREEILTGLDEPNGTAAYDSSGNARTVRLSGGVTRVAGKVGAHAVSFDGTTGEAATSGPVASTDGSFTVSAWVKPDVLDDQVRTAVSQEGTTSSGFFLGYRPETKRWGLLLTDADASNVGGLRVDSPTTPRTDQWTQLVGVYDAAAQQMRLYVDGEPAGDLPYAKPRWAANGPLVIGRAKFNGQKVDWWKGSIDNVQVLTGARTDEQVKADFDNPVEARDGFPVGVVAQFVGPTGERLTTVRGTAPAGYHFESQLGLPATGTTDTRQLYSCRTGADQFVSTAADCEGKEALGPLTTVYTKAAAGVPTSPLYRCVTTGGDHFVFNEQACNGHGSTNDGLLGYTRAYAGLVRHVQDYKPWQHTSLTWGAPEPYQSEAHLGFLSSVQQPGTTPLHSCADGTDEFTSTDAACEGKTVRMQLGWVWTSAPTGVEESAELLRCKTSEGERFDSLDPDCEGSQRDRSLGFVVIKD
ncbi:hypothetical protein VV02_04125 [Luteipulveratus mongoliensis]|uniref:LamG-like jellyroll fold domain-containing protein n=1 Tax=Luteipulveratus mongoliensis TaxID=571913 RepID=A0A0K1JEV1_9MICO|nr:hypothetical protein VV02_04125 [Luteipulveratus mongoliensis]